MAGKRLGQAAGAGPEALRGSSLGMWPCQNADTGPVRPTNWAAVSSAPVRSSASSRKEVMGKPGLYAPAAYVKPS